MPSATAFESCIVKSVVKLWMFTGVLKNALPACCTPPLVSCRRESSRPVLPLKVMVAGAAANPLGKLMAGAAGPMVKVALATELLERLVAVAIALIVVVWFTAMGAA